MQTRTLCSMIAAAAVVSFAASGCVPLKLLTESAESARVTIAPKDALVVAGKTQQFVAVVAGSSNTAVDWSVNGVLGGNASVGTIAGDGIYTAPAAVPNSPAVSILAVLRANTSKSGTAIAVIVKPGTGDVNRARQTLPIKLGTSGGNTRDLSVSGDAASCCAGTLGALVQRGGAHYILSNNHVLTRWEQASIGEAIAQPGLADPSCTANGSVVAHLTQAAPLRAANVDAALAAVVPGTVDPTGSILEFGAASGGTFQPAPPADTIAEPAVGMRVAKSDRTTGLTCSPLGAIHVDVRVNYTTACSSGATFTLTFTNQVIINGAGFSAFGDSGSLIVNAQTAQPVALLFAASPTVTVGNPIQDVLAALRDPSSGAVPALVAGGTHPIACPVSASAGAPALASALPDTALGVAIQAKNKHANELMADPAILGVDVGRSDDNPGEAAVVLYLEQGKPHGKIPAEVDGVRTKVIFTRRFPAQSAAPQPDEGTQAGQILSPGELSRAAEIKQRHRDRLLADPAILAVGVGASGDNPEEAAVVLFVDRSALAPLIPSQMDGARTKVVASDEFRAFGWNETAPQACQAPHPPKR